ncbi:Rossmann-like and DUF2520 domain-containing protein [Flavobacterium sp. 7A]|uniref:Rossmann-like and DUF2520 domain-containing protein n=1 Tax=Flavobacterium sp. 7A TaxID=2940571 RepID=UPI002225E601|nr:Rossmann-like and DUF2520 domain-containing protein [Flavobacterium sp. 7A]MCW2118455.1 putative short-subunit dehydrogenase-like oxidoreductase (DUF2520 family) [Flavobacterium sp. 7A]
MVKVVVIGSGNLAQHLIVAIQEAEQSEKSIQLIQVYARTVDNIAHLVPKQHIISDFQQLKEADVYIIAVSDNAINTVASQLPFNNKLVVHTSGAMPMDTLDSKNKKGVFYPLQTFTKNKKVAFETIPICLETENEADYMSIKLLANAISNKTYNINSVQRKALHVAAVFVNNFTNHLYQIGEEICDEHQLPFEILHPLIQETAAKIRSISPQQAQTGPAIRKDSKTIIAHETLLTHSKQKQLYKILTQSIQDNGKKL